MNIKVCGMTDVGQITKLADFGVDYTGMIFYKKSPRYAVGKIHAADLGAVSTRTKLTGVFVNEEEEEVKKIIGRYQLRAVQLCGDEPPAYCRTLMNSVEVIKVIPVEDRVDEMLLQKYKDSCDHFLFDTRSQKYGGTGTKFDWSVLNETNIPVNFFLSGGIGPDDANAVCHVDNPRLYGVDINSRFEESPGVKNLARVKIFIDKIKN